MNVEVRAIREEEMSECLEMWKEVWPENRPGFFEKYFYGDQNFQPEYTRVAVLDGGIVSAVQIVKRTVSCNGFTLTLGGIANVATRPDYRGEGFAQECLRQAVEVMEADAIDFSMLFTGIPEFYSKQGYQSVTTTRLIGELRPEPLHSYTRMVVRPYEDRDDACIHLIHAAYNRDRPIAVRRSAPYWRDWLGWAQGQAPSRAMVAEQEGVIIGYCLYTVDEERGRVHLREFGVRDGAEQALDALLDEAAETARAHHIPSLSVPLQEELAVEEVCARLFLNKEEEIRRNGMVRFFHLDILMRGLAPALTDRWRRCGAPAGELAFEGPYGACRIESSGSFLRIEEIDTPADALNQAELFDLLTGQCLPNDRLPFENARFAHALFPAHCRWFWELDGF